MHPRTLHSYQWGRALNEIAQALPPYLKYYTYLKYARRSLATIL